MGKIKIPSTVVKHKPIQKEKKAKKDKEPKLDAINQIFLKGMPDSIELILKLGYTKEQAEVFADFFTFHMTGLANLAKKQIKEMVDYILRNGWTIATTFGLIAAGIDPDDFSRRSKQNIKQKKATKKPKEI